MSLTSQSVRNSVGRYDPNNPNNLLDSLKKPFTILRSSTAPSVEDGTYGDYFINTTTADFYEKGFDGLWTNIYNFNTGAGSGLTAIENESSPGLFKTILGSTAFFKGLGGTTDEIFVDGSDADTVILSMEPTYVPPLLSRLVGSRKIGSAPFAPPVSADSTQGYEIGDLWTIQGVSGALYYCKNPAVGAAEWIKIAPYTGSNVGLLGVDLFKQLTTAGDFEFRKIVGVTDDVVVDIQDDSVVVGMDDSYKPVSLNLVPNVKNNYTGSPVGPTINDDSTLGYQAGSIFTSVSVFPEGGHVWVCGDATVGNAVWYDISNSVSVSQKDFVQFRIGDTRNYTQTIGTVYADVNFGPSTPVVAASKIGTLFSAVFDGVRTVFRRSAVPSALALSKRGYRVSYSFFFQTPQSSDIDSYAMIFKRKSEGDILPESSSSHTLYTDPTISSGRDGCLTCSFIFEETSNAQRDYYFQIKGKKSGGGAGANIDIAEWGVSFDEI